jgi:hypothetical protein
MRREAPAAARNRQPILEVLQPRLPATGLVLEIASGTGEHVVHYAAARPLLTFQPSDPDADARASIDDWARHPGPGATCGRRWRSMSPGTRGRSRARTPCSAAT